jgi:hypothetical protein
MELNFFFVMIGSKSDTGSTSAERIQHIWIQAELFQVLLTCATCNMQQCHFGSPTLWQDEADSFELALARHCHIAEMVQFHGHAAIAKGRILHGCPSTGGRSPHGCGVHAGGHLYLSDVDNQKVSMKRMSA